MEILFILKKIISGLLMPFSIGIFLLLLGLLFLFRKKIQKAKIFFAISILWLLLISNTFVANTLLAPLENSYPKLKNVPQNIDYIVFLGGDMENRGWEVLRLHHKLPHSTIITSGYEGRGSVPEAIKTTNILKSIGINSERILTYPKPKDTKEEAKNILQILGKKPFILVTSAYHMERAMLTFKNEGLNPIPAPTDYQIKDSDKLASFPNGYSLKKTEKAWHEYIGILWLKIVMFLT